MKKELMDRDAIFGRRFCVVFFLPLWLAARSGFTQRHEAAKDSRIYLNFPENALLALPQSPRWAVPLVPLRTYRAESKAPRPATPCPR